jgi:hypothetical protein
MNNSVEVCGGQRGCSSVVTHACNCGNPVVFLCTNCIVTHLSEPVTHIFISLEQARELVSDSGFNESFHGNLAKYTVLKASIQNYIGRIESYKENLMKVKNDIMTLVEQEFQAKFDLLSDCKRNAAGQLEIIKRRMKTLIKSGDEVLNIYEERGLKGLLPDYIHSFEIKTEALEDATSKMFMISHNELIYYTQHNSSQLMTFDTGSNRIQRIELGNTITNKFCYSTTCMLPDGNVMIVGRYSPNCGDTYRFNPMTGQCTKLNPLNYPRGYVGLICHDKYLYALGGFDTNKVRRAERMEWAGNGWSILPDMKDTRQYHCIIPIENRIYLIGGLTSTIEFYDVLNNTFNILPNISVNSGYINTALIGDIIYIINQTQLTILNKEFISLETKQLTCGKSIDSMNNQVIRGKKVYFHSTISAYIFALMQRPRYCQKS